MLNVCSGNYIKPIHLDFKPFEMRQHAGKTIYQRIWVCGLRIVKKVIERQSQHRKGNFPIVGLK